MKGINNIRDLKAMVLSPLKKILIGNRAAKDRVKKDPENKPRKGEISSEANP